MFRILSHGFGDKIGTKVACLLADEAEDSPSAASADKASTSQQPTVPVVPTVLVGETMRSQGSGQELKWDHRLNLIGRAMKDPLLHLCEICSLPVLIYGRMVSVKCDGRRVSVRCDGRMVSVKCDRRRVSVRCDGRMVSVRCDGRMVSVRCDGRRVSVRCDGRMVSVLCDQERHLPHTLISIPLLLRISIPPHTSHPPHIPPPTPPLPLVKQKKCRHAFCRDCAKKAAGVCPKCKEGDQIFEEATMGNVYICTHGGGR